MADDPPSPPSSELSSPPSIESDHDSTDALSTARPAKRRKRNNTKEPITTPFPRDDSQIPANDPTDWETISLSSDSLSSAPGSPSHSEWASRDDAQTECLWRDCPFGEAGNNDELVIHVQSTHCATGGPKRVKYICEWGECQRKTSSHPSGYALKAHMRSHTKEKPYYCALPECDKAFTRSDALSKHMRTVHEPEMPRGGATTNPTDIPTPAAASTTNKPGGKAGKQAKNATNNNNNSNGGINIKPDPLTPHSATNPNEPSPASDNITYIPAHHPITGQPGFMIHYPPDIIFTAWESSIPADQLMRLLRRQLHWAEKEHRELEAENAELERRRREEWELKEVLMDGVMESEWARAQRSMMDEEEERGLLDDIPLSVREAMEADVDKGLRWGPAEPPWRRRRKGPRTLRERYREAVGRMNDDVGREAGEEMRGGYEDAIARLRADGEAEDDRLDVEHEKGMRERGLQQQRYETPGNDDHDEDGDSDDDEEDGGDGGLEPPPTGRSGGFDGERDPYDNYFEDQEARFEMLRAERERNRARDKEGVRGEEGGGGGGANSGDGGKGEGGDAEMDAVGVLMGMGGRG
ncbi:hypothetical protein LTS10_011835 [Elasticomyces elasticus]|nr:hypothetical protein LTS10_011835 [Elasticomyces elasticus]